MMVTNTSASILMFKICFLASSRCFVDKVARLHGEKLFICENRTIGELFFLECPYFFQTFF